MLFLYPKPLFPACFLLLLLTGLPALAQIPDSVSAAAPPAPSASLAPPPPPTAAAGDSVEFLDRLLDFFEFDINRRKVAAQPGTYPTKLVLAPIISYSPETNWGAGAGAKFLFKLPKSGEETRTSNLPISAQYTLNNQLLLYSGYTVFFPREAFILKGNLEYSNFPRLFYGIGNNTPHTNEEVYGYRTFLFEPLLVKRVVGKLFLGGGFRYLSVGGVELEKDSPLNQSTVPGVRGSRSTGIETALTYDTRDNVLNATRGMLAEATHGWYDSRFGGNQQYELTKIDTRQYWALGHHRGGRSVLAAQLYGYFATGAVPLLEYGALGGGDLMRGYYEGRFLDRSYAAAQVEFRRPVSRRFGFVAFASAGRVADKVSDFSFSHIKPAVGSGVRFKIVKAENLNLRFDAAVGKDTYNFYFNVAEAF